MFDLYFVKVGIKNACCISTFRKIFTENLNLSFLIPKKDQCPKCFKVENGLIAPEDQESFDCHKKSKEMVKMIKDADKKNEDPKTCVASFDLANVCLHGSKD